MRIMNVLPSFFIRLKNIGPALSLAGLMALSGCLHGTAKSRAMVSVDIDCPSFTKVAEETTTLMSRRGYVPTEPPDSQTQSYANAHSRALGPRILSFLQGGQARIEIIAQPTASGWRLYAMGEPIGYDTSFPRHKIHTILEQVRQRCEAEVSPENAR
jgi:hypothetical protein